MDPDPFPRGKTSNSATGSIQSPQAAQHICTHHVRRVCGDADGLLSFFFEKVLLISPATSTITPRRTEEEYATRQNKSLSAKTWIALLLQPSALSPV